MSAAPPSAKASHDSYEGVAGQNLAPLKHFQQTLAPVERLRCTERLWERWTAKGKAAGKGKNRRLAALKSAILVLYLEAASPPHLAARALCHPDALAPGPEGVSPLPSCELVEGTTIISCVSACAGVPSPVRGSRIAL